MRTAAKRDAMAWIGIAWLDIADGIALNSGARVQQDAEEISQGNDLMGVDSDGRGTAEPSWEQPGQRIAWPGEVKAWPGYAERLRMRCFARDY